MKFLSLLTLALTLSVSADEFVLVNDILVRIPTAEPCEEVTKLENYGPVPLPERTGPYLRPRIIVEDADGRRIGTMKQDSLGRWHLEDASGRRTTTFKGKK